MAKVKVEDWDTTAASNTDINSINIDEGMSPSDVNNAIREMMAQLATWTTAATPVGVVQAYSGSSAPAGWLLLNGATIGSAASTATNKSDDYEALYTLWWNDMADAQATVAGGRGVSAAADFAANKNMTMPNATGKAIFGREASSSLLTSAVSLDGSVLGNTGGDEESQAHTHLLSLNVLESAVEAGTTSKFTGNPNDPTGAASGNKHGGDSGNVPPAIILTWIVKY